MGRSSVECKKCLMRRSVRCCAEYRPDRVQRFEEHRPPMRNWQLLRQVQRQENSLPDYAVATLHLGLSGGVLWSGSAGCHAEAV